MKKDYKTKLKKINTVMKKIFLILLCAVLFASCGDDGPTPQVSDGSITINSDGTTSTGDCVTVVDANNIYINGVKYSVVSGHVEVTGYDNDVIEKYPDAKLFSKISYGVNTWEVTQIGSSAFLSCTSLKSVTIPNSVISIGEKAFDKCTGLTSVTIGNSVTSIDRYAFSCCSGLTSVTIPNSVTSIGNYAFEYCTGLTSITIPNSVTSIGVGAFPSCSGLTSISVESGNQTYDSRDNCNAIIETSSNTLVAGCMNTVIPSSVTSIGVAAFYGCSDLTSVTIPNSVTKIRDYAFSWCTGLTSVTIPNSVTSIGRYAFSDCKGLTSVTIPNSVTSIGNDAFSSCIGLTSVTIGNSVTNIGSYAFYNCSGLTSVYNYATTPQTLSSTDVFSNAANCTLYVPAASIETYKAADYWKEFKNIVAM